MLKGLHLPTKLKASLLKSGVTGEIGAHGAQTNLDSIKRLLKRDPYVTFSIDAVLAKLTAKAVTYDSMIEIMATALGITPERYCQPGPSYIDPELTVQRINEMFNLIDASASRGELFVLATAHPGSLISYYHQLGHYITHRGGRIYLAPELVKVGEYRWIDNLEGVHVLSDEGNLLHTHDSAPFAIFLDHLTEPPALVLTDHGYAGAALNRGLKTVAIHDVDDPGLALAAHLGCDMLAIPMNDNQLNLPTVRALKAVMADRLATLHHHD